MWALHMLWTSKMKYVIIPSECWACYKLQETKADSNETYICSKWNTKMKSVYKYFDLSFHCSILSSILLEVSRKVYIFMNGDSSIASYIMF